MSPWNPALVDRSWWKTCIYWPDTDCLLVVSRWHCASNTFPVNSTRWPAVVQSPDARSNSFVFLKAWLCYYCKPSSAVDGLLVCLGRSESRARPRPWNTTRHFRHSRGRRRGRSRRRGTHAPGKQWRSKGHRYTVKSRQHYTPIAVAHPEFHFVDTNLTNF